MRRIVACSATRPWSICSPRLVDVLRLLVARPGELVTKEQLLEGVWPDVNVTDNALARAISDIRSALGDSPAAPRYIQTVTRRGYRFLGQVDAAARGAATGVAAADALEPYRAWSEGRLQLETLQVSALPGAVASFERAVALAPQDALARAGLANARFMRYERRAARTSRITRCCSRPSPMRAPRADSIRHWARPGRRCRS